MFCKSFHKKVRSRINNIIDSISTELPLALRKSSILWQRQTEDKNKEGAKAI